MFDLNDDEFVLASIKPFKDADAIKRKNIGVAISFSWMDCFDGEISPEASIGLPITLRNGRVVTHEFYINALVDLLSRHEFGQLKFILAGELQWYNLMTARGESFDDSIAKQRALDDLFLLEKKWIEKFSAIINEKLAGKKITFEHWRDLIQEEGCEKQKLLFQKLNKEGSNINASYEKEVKAACKREENKGRAITKESVRLYLDEETPVFMNKISPQNPNKIDCFLYPAKVDLMVNTFNAIGPENGKWMEIHISIKTTDEIFRKWKSSGKKCILTPAEGVSRTTLEELAAYVNRRAIEEATNPPPVKKSPNKRNKQKNAYISERSNLNSHTNTFNEEERDFEKNAVARIGTKEAQSKNKEHFELKTSSSTTSLGFAKPSIDELMVENMKHHRTTALLFAPKPIRKTFSASNSQHLSNFGFLSINSIQSNVHEIEKDFKNDPEQLYDEITLILKVLQNKSFAGVPLEPLMEMINHLSQTIQEVRALLNSELGRASSPSCLS